MLDSDLAVICAGPFRVFSCLESNTKREGYINFNLRGTFSGRKTRTTVGEGMQNNNTWLCFETTLETTDAIAIKVYAQVDFETIMNTVGVEDHISYCCLECLKAYPLNKK